MDHRPDELGFVVKFKLRYTVITFPWASPTLCAHMAVQGATQLLQMKYGACPLSVIQRKLSVFLAVICC